MSAFSPSRSRDWEKEAQDRLQHLYRFVNAELEFSPINSIAWARNFAQTAIYYAGAVLTIFATVICTQLFPLSASLWGVVITMVFALVFFELTRFDASMFLALLFRVETILLVFALVRFQLFYSMAAVLTGKLSIVTAIFKGFVTFVMYFYCIMVDAAPSTRAPWRRVYLSLCWLNLLRIIVTYAIYREEYLAPFQYCYGKDTCYELCTQTIKAAVDLIVLVSKFCYVSFTSPDQFVTLNQAVFTRAMHMLTA